MAKQTINIGSSANDGTGDPLRTAFDKINDNFDEIYTELGGSSLSNLKLTGNKLISDNTNGDIELDPNGTGKVIINADFEVKGTTTQMNATVMQVEDNLVEFNRNSSGSDIDAGMYINRGGAGNNAVLYWNEGEDVFKAVLSTSDATATSVTDTSKATIDANFQGESISINTIKANDSSAINVENPFQINATLSANTIDTDRITTSDSTSVTIDTGLLVTGTLQANKIDINVVQNSDSTAVEFDTDIKVEGNLHADQIITRTIYSNDSTRVEIADGLDVTGRINAVTIGGLNSGTLTLDAPVDCSNSFNFAVNDNYATSTVALSLTTSVNSLGAGDNYTLADGNEGQIMYFTIAGGGDGVADTVVQLSKVRNPITGAIDTTYDWHPFIIPGANADSTQGRRSLATAVFASGAWCVDIFEG